MNHQDHEIYRDERHYQIVMMTAGGGGVISWGSCLQKSHKDVSTYSDKLETAVL